MDTVCSTPVGIGRDVWLVLRAIVLCGVTVGDSGVVGGAAAVSKGVAAGTTVVGVPAFSICGKPAFIPAELQAEVEASRRAP